jgi:hypothetical protein
LANELQVPLISWAGTDRLQGDYCFRLGNGDCGGDASLVVSWLVKHGHRRIAVLSEITPNGEEYFRYFRMECRHDPTQAYAERRRAQPKSDRDIKRCLKRYIARQLFRQLENPLDEQ